MLFLFVCLFVCLFCLFVCLFCLLVCASEILKIQMLICSYGMICILKQLH